MSEVFLFDTNAFIEPFARYYPFDLLPQYWEWLAINIANGKVCVLDRVYDELVYQDNELAEWTKNKCKDFVIPSADLKVVDFYGDILTHLNNSTVYKAEAVSKWAEAKIADGWLIACAKAKELTLITMEQPAGKLSEKYPAREAKIPDICRALNVQCNELFYALRKLDFKLI